MSAYSFVCGFNVHVCTTQCLDVGLLYVHFFISSNIMWHIRLTCMMADRLMQDDQMPCGQPVRSLQLIDIANGQLKY